MNLCAVALLFNEFTCHWSAIAPICASEFPEHCSGLAVDTYVGRPGKASSQGSRPALATILILILKISLVSVSKGREVMPTKGIDQ